MRITRLIAGTVTAGLLGLTPVALGAPANAAVTVTTAVSLSSSKTAYVYGSALFFDSAVTTDDPNNIYPPGTATLYMMRGGSSTWEAVSTDDSVSYLYFEGLKARSNAQYKVVYPGGTDYDGDVFLPSESAPFAIGVARKMDLTVKSGTTIFKGKIAPKYKKKKIVIKKKVRKKWKKFRTVKTNKKSRFAIRLPALGKRGKRTYWKFTVPGNKTFLATSVTGYTYRYRTTSARIAIE